MFVMNPRQTLFGWVMMKVNTWLPGIGLQENRTISGFTVKISQLSMSSPLKQAGIITFGIKRMTTH